MNLNKCCLALLLLVAACVSVSCHKLKFVAFKGPFGGFAGIKYRKPKLLGLKHGLGFGGHSFGGHSFGGHGFGGGFHSSGYEHHEYHSSNSGGFGGWLGRK